MAIAYLNDDYGKNGVLGAQKELTAHGLKLVAEVPVELKDTDLRPHVMKLRKAAPDMVLLWVPPVHAVKIVGTGKAMKFVPQWMSTSTCSDFPLMMHISKGLWQGVIAATFAELPDSESPKLQKIKKEAYEQYAAPKERWGLFYYAGIYFTEPFVEGLRRTGRDLTRERLVSAMEGIKDFKGIGGRVSYAEFDAQKPYETRQGTKEVFLVQCLEGGKGKKLTDWLTLQYP